MNQDVKASTLILIIIIFGGLLGAKFWASSASKSINVYSYMHHHPDGDSYIKINNKLMGYNIAGHHIATIDLADFNLQEQNTSDFAFFSNGDLLLRKQAQQKNVIENLQRYLRFTNPTDKNTSDTEQGFIRCNPQDDSCTDFSEETININGAFSLAIDIKTDRVFIADTSRHQVYMYSEKGVELDIETKLRFPNQIEVLNNQLYVADTNHHRLISFDISENKIAGTIENLDIRTEQSRTLTETWPPAFLLYGSQRWVLNSKNSMSHGGIYIFDQSGEFIEKLKLPDNADPFGMIKLGEQVLISDFSQDKIYQFSLEGEPLGEFESPELQEIQTELAKKRIHYQWLNSLFSILFAVSLAGGFILAWHQQNQMKKAALIETDLIQQTNLPNIEEPVLHWVKLSTRVKAANIILIVLFVVCDILLGMAFLLMNMDVKVFVVATWQLQLILFIVSVLAILTFRKKIAVTENTVIVYPLVGAKIICPKAEIIFDDDFIIFGKSIFQIQQLTKMFTADDVENLLYPAIKMGKQVGRIEMQAILAGNNRVRVIQAIIVLGLLGLFLYHGVFYR